VATILYFATLVDKLGTASEEVVLPAAVTDVRALLAWLRQRGASWELALTETGVRVTVNRQFAAPETKIDNTMEIAIVPMRLG
jgi:molybdopterin synthase sulfur carrier subunit